MYRARATYAIVMAFLVAPLFLTPLLLSAGTVSELDGMMGGMDNAKAIEALPFWARPAYLFGDVFCHQMQRRSLFINDNQMPVCARDAGIFVGFFLGAVISLFAEPRQGEENRAATLLRFQSKLSFENKPNRMKLLALLFLLPLVLDGGVQLITQVMHGNGLIHFYYESSNILRVVTGALFGMPLACYFGILLTPKTEPQRNPPSAGRSK